MTDAELDVVVVGSGVAGLAAALTALGEVSTSTTRPLVNLARLGLRNSDFGARVCEREGRRDHVDAALW